MDYFHLLEFGGFWMRFNRGLFSCRGGFAAGSGMRWQLDTLGRHRQTDNPQRRKLKEPESICGTRMKQDADLARYKTVT
jgi:hypothetical protein